MSVPYTFANQNGPIPLAQLDANFAAIPNLATYTGALTASNVSTTGNVTTAGYFVGNFLGNITGNLTVPGSNTQVIVNVNGNAGASAGLTYSSDSNTLAILGVVSAVGNVYGNYVVGNAAFMTGIPETYSNANVAAYLPTYTSVITASSISASGNVRGANLNTSGNVTVSNISASGNIAVSNISASGNIVVDGNVTAPNLTGPIFAAYSDTYTTLTNSAVNVLTFAGIDTNVTGAYNSSTGAFTPLVAGWYQVNASFIPEYVSGTQEVTAFLGLYKNGDVVAVGTETALTSTWGILSTSNINKLVYFNGSTDYIDIRVTMVSNTGVWQAGISPTCYFQAVWVRGA